MAYTLIQIKEIIRDSKDCPRLNTWETSFLSSINQQILFTERNWNNEEFTLTPKQAVAMNKIEDKVYEV